jgi:hypothetical protein
MLKSLDIVIGFSVVMLVLSMAVTVLTQAVASALNWRGKHLLDGLTALLHQLDDKALPLPVARQVAERVLKHRLIQSPTGRYGSVIEREELIRLLLEFGAAAPPKAMAAAAGGGAPVTVAANPSPMASLAQALANTGIGNPAQVAEQARLLAVKLEATEPTLAAHARHARALAIQAESQFLARINGWFDQTMDRVAQRFAYWTRVVTALAAILVAFGLQLDAFGLLNRLSMDDQLRNALVARAVQQQAPLQTAVTDLVPVPASLEAWRQGWAERSVIGMALSAMLLGMGAPFWFNALKHLVSLRPLLAAKDDAQRRERQGASA